MIEDLLFALLWVQMQASYSQNLVSASSSYCQIESNTCESSIHVYTLFPAISCMIRK